jgi:hypothetical protein
MMMVNQHRERRRQKILIEDNSVLDPKSGLTNGLNVCEPLKRGYEIVEWRLEMI